MTAEEHAKVLVVEDEEHVANLFVAVLSDHYDVTHAATGSEAIEILEADSFDVVLLDRRMPEMSGDRTLEHIEQREIECRVAMVSGVDPDYDVIDMGFDDYLVKPVENDVLVETVDRLLALDEYESIYQELSAKLVKKNVIEVEKPPEELQRHEEFQRLRTEIDALTDELETMQADRGFDPRLLPDG